MGMQIPHAKTKNDRVVKVDSEEAGFGMIAKAGQVHWRSVQVASESMEAFGVVGIDRRVIVNAETKVIPTMPPEYKRSK